MKRISAVALIVLLLMLILPTNALADSPPPDMTITIKVNHAPAEVAYIDILVKDNLPEVNKTMPNPLISKQYPSLANSELYGCDSGGYVSYSLYYTRPESNNLGSLNDEIKYNHSGQNHFSGVMNTDIESIKIVLLNSSGKILRTSEAIQLKPHDNMHDFLTPKVNYDFNTSKAQVQLPTISAMGVPLTIIALIFSGLIRIALSTGIEVLVALPFRIKPLRVIVLANIVTQVIISFGIPITTIYASYTLSVILFEILTYLLEFGAYMKFTKEPKWGKVLFYTITANTASLLLGLLLNSAGLFWA